MTQETPVHCLDLAPKLKRPLSVWNPLDYLRLLYWVFYFPQALRWYVEEFGGGYIPPGEMNWRKGWELIQENIVQRNLLLQALLLTVITPLVLSAVLKFKDFDINWVGVALGVVFLLAFGAALAAALGVALGVVFGVVFGVFFGVASAVAFGVASDVASVTLGVAFFLAFSLALGVLFGVFFGVSSGMAFGVLGIFFSSAFLLILSMVSGVVFKIGFNADFDVVFGVVFAMSLGMALGVASGMVLGVASGVSNSLVLALSLGLVSVAFHSIFPWSGIVFGFAGVAFVVAILRPESWLIGLFFNIQPFEKGSLLFLRITSVPIPLLSVRLKKLLEEDWEAGLHYANQLLDYTLQFIPVVEAINQVLNQIPSEKIISRVAQLAENPCDWKLMRFVSADLNEMLQPEAIMDMFYLPVSSKQRLQNFFLTETPLKTYTRATSAGFWYLHEQEPVKAEQAFSEVRSIFYGEEMYTLAQHLGVFHHAKDFDDIVNIKSTSPYQGGDTEGVLRPNTWQAIFSLHRVVEDAQLVKRSVSRTTRSFTLNRAQGELTNILNNSQTLPEAERGIIIDIAKTWQKALLQIAAEVGEISITKPVRNPYIIGDPVLGEKFVGREELIRQLEELWVMGEQLQSVVIYGHRRMGKTSILRNAANSIGSGVKVVYVNMLNAGNISEGVGEVLMAISDAVSDALNIPPPDDDKLLKLPEITFKRYLKQVVQKLKENSLQALIIALDEFEIIEELITAGKIPKNFLGYLRGLLQMDSKIAFAFAGLHTLEEMTADYFQPFFASVIPIHVGFMERAVTRQILANPSLVNPNINKEDLKNTEDFLLDYKPEALDKIYEFTHGQPYLVQLIGFVLVRRYNDQIFELGRKRDPVFTVEDVEAVIDNAEFFEKGRYYFDGVWSQAKQGAQGQQAILEVLAPYPEGLSYDDAIAEVSKKGFDEESLKKALDTLQRHDVVKETQGRLSIIVELFRLWLVKEK